MYSLRIQGDIASKFAFKQNSGHEFRSFVESLVLNYVTIVCSKYRTDLIYFSEHDRQDELLRAWFKVCGIPFDLKLAEEFKRSEGQNEVFENYFVDLVYLARKPDRFYLYQKQLSLTVQQEPKHPIHQKLISCAQHLASNTKSFSTPLIMADTPSVAYQILKETKTFATNAASGYIDN